MFKSLLVSFLLLPFLLIGQSDTLTEVPFVAYWAKGDTYNFEVKKIERKIRNGNLEKNDTSSYTGIFEVLDSTATSYTIKWTPINHSIVDLDLAPEVMEKLATTNLEYLIYTTNELGEYQGIENIEEIQSLARAVVDGLLKDTSVFKVTLPEQTRNTLESTLRRMESRQFIEMGMFPELRHLHSPFGAAYSRYDTIHYEDVFTIPLWQSAAKANGTIWIDSIDVTNEFAHIRQLVEVDESEMKEQLKSYLSKLGMPEEKLAKMLPESKYFVGENNDFYFYYYPGIPVYVDYFKEVVFEAAEEKAVVTNQVQISWID